MRGCENWATEATATVALVVGLALGTPGAPAAAAVAPAEGPADLQRVLDKVEKELGKAEAAVRGKDPGRVSLLLQRLDEELADFEEASRFEAMTSAIQAARTAARSGDLREAEVALLKVRRIYPALSDYSVVRLAEESSRAALRAAQEGDAVLCLQSIDRFDGSIRTPLLLKRVREAREAVVRARTMMVRRDMEGGAKAVAAIRGALDGLKYAGALSRALFGLQVGSEFLTQGALSAAKDQVQRALRELRTAVEIGPKAQGPALGDAEAKVEEVWRRLSRPRSGDAAKLLEAERTVESLREQQS